MIFLHFHCLILRRETNNNNSNLIRLITSSPEVTSHVFVTPLRMLLKKKTGEENDRA